MGMSFNGTPRVCRATFARTTRTDLVPNAENASIETVVPRRCSSNLFIDRAPHPYVSDWLACVVRMLLID
jgi:hypothetical protein